MSFVPRAFAMTSEYDQNVVVGSGEAGKYLAWTLVNPADTPGPDEAGFRVAVTLGVSTMIALWRLRADVFGEPVHVQNPSNSFNT
jgi:hypothetical protein